MTINTRLEKLEALYHDNGQGDDFAFFLTLLEIRPQHHIARESYVCVYAPQSLFDRFRLQHHRLTAFGREKLDELQAGGVEAVLICDARLWSLDLWKWDNARGDVIEGFDFATMRPETLILWRDYEPGQFLRAMLERTKNHASRNN